MRKSSAQLEFSYSAPSAESSADRIEIDESVSFGDSSAPFRPPSYGISADLVAVTARRAGRLNAASITDQEHEQLLEERQRLLDKKFSGEIMPREQNRLEYVRWSLDRIEDAKFGADLDALENAVSRYEHFLKNLDDLRQQLKAKASSRRR